MIEIDYSKNVNITYLKGKTVAILGYRKDGGQQRAQFLRDNGIKVVIGLRQQDEVWTDAVQDGYDVYTVWDATEQADIMQVW